MIFFFKPKPIVVDAFTPSEPPQQKQPPVHGAPGQRAWLDPGPLAV